MHLFRVVSSFVSVCIKIPKRSAEYIKVYHVLVSPRPMTNHRVPFAFLPPSFLYPQMALLAAWACPGGGG